MSNKTKHLQRQLKFHCANCQTIYQLLEIQQGKNDNCADNCPIKWQELLINHYQEKFLFHLSQQPSESADLAEQLGIKVNKKKH